MAGLARTVGGDSLCPRCLAEKRPRVPTIAWPLRSFASTHARPQPVFSATTPEAKRNVDTAFVERARTLIKRGYKPKVAVELVLQETEIEHGNDPKFMEKARADAEDFLQRVRTGLI